MIDLVLDASPPNSTSQQQIEYQTEVLTTLMENLLNTELFGSESNISNVCYLAARLVDKLWQGQLSRDPHEVSVKHALQCCITYLGGYRRIHNCLFLGVRFHCKASDTS